MESVREVMTDDVVCLKSETAIGSAAVLMKTRDIGDVVVVEDNGELCGIITDRDLVTRGLAEGLGVADQLRQLRLGDVVTVTPDDPVDRAIMLMRENAVRRLPVVENKIPVGIVSLGDLAISRDPSSVLADISRKPPNNEVSDEELSGATQ